MKQIKLLILLFFGLTLFNSCGEKDPDEPTELSTLGFVKTGEFNDENDDGFAEIGETVTYTFTVTNTGTTTISQLVINDDRIAVLDLSLSPSELAPEATGTATVNYQLTFADLAEGSITNQAEVSGIDPNGDTAVDLSDPVSNYSNDNTITNFDPIVTYENGYFVVNEGGYTHGNSSLTFVSDDGTVVQDVYKTVNGEAIGDVLQSMYFHGDNAYFVVNNSHKIIVTDRYTMENITTIEGTGVNNPRYFVAVGNTGYVTNWGDPNNASDDFVSVINLLSNTITSTVSVGEGPEKMLVDNNNIYINLQGGWNQNNQVSILDTSSNTIISSLIVADVPNSNVKDSNGDIWVLCAGKPSFTGAESAGQLVHIQNEIILETFDFAVTEHPANLVIDSDVLYFTLDGKVYSKGIDSAAPIEYESGMDGLYYGMNANDGQLFTLNAGNFTSEGTLNVFDLSTNTAIQTVTTGVVPNNVVFN